MMRTWKSLGWQMALAAALLPSAARADQIDGPAPAPAPEPDKTDALVNKFKEEVRTALGEMEKRLKGSIENLETNGNLKTAKFQTDLDEIKRQLGQLSRLQADTDDLKKQIAQIRADFDGLRNRIPSTQISSLYGPTAQPTGRVRLVNTFPEPMTILLNGRAYRLAPGETRVTDPLPAGPFEYMVLGVQPDMQSRTLPANDVYTITVHPR